MLVDVKDLSRSSNVIETIDRCICYNVGWEKVRYRNRWFQLFDGVRVPPFLDLCNPIPERK